ncbi:A24 family peptidase [Sphingomonas baiyangensis]|uniref:Peptidase n=1 Tax=Sphingomonas baiyangensis TaxID=2572576 RepID=A0A4U1L9K9_9SPHN|nr:prepilin peptidase [Sphingomonas baiyangensis]TKD53070.1 peptidase [Sphingomonas baiyangensis]
MGDVLRFVMPVALAALLLSAGIEDVRKREIANWKNAAIALAAPLWWWAIGLEAWPGAAIQIGVAIGVFALFAAAFAAGMMGGGDVKMIAALALWFPLGAFFDLLLLMSVLGGAITLAMLIEHRRAQKPGSPEIPYGVAIACAALLSLHQPLLNHFG